MINCPVCSHSNDDFAIICASCGSYVQDRVPTLDFFATVWLMVESPTTAFKKIIVAEHKNYVVFLSLFLGIASAFALMWAKKSGNNFDNLFPVLLFGTFLGIALSIPLLFSTVTLLHVGGLLVGGKGRFKETYAVVGWSLVPVMFSVVLILPLELATLGLLLFSTNPSAYQVKPVVTAVLVGLDGLCAVWSLLLATIGFSMAHRLQRVKSFIVIIIVASAIAYLSFILYSSFNI